ncbi:hypothetical protein LP420_18410 [Massilia sp. B-10]|nr:hypothetical protein LP420_18410 [Massilia sp. B-10]
MIALSASVAYWAMELYKSAQRPLAAMSDSAQPDPSPDAAKHPVRRPGGRGCGQQLPADGRGCPPAPKAWRSWSPTASRPRRSRSAMNCRAA